MWHHSKAQAGERTAGKLQNVKVGVPDAVQASFGWLHPNTVVERMPAGFSGATVWKVTCRDQSYALKRWPVGHPVHLDLSSIHQLIIQLRLDSLSAIPEVCQTTKNESVLSVAGTLWDACSWQRGQPDSQPDNSRLKSAMELLARVHVLWRTGNERRSAICPAVLLQHRRLYDWTTMEIEQVKQQATHVHLFCEAVNLFKKHRSQALQRLASWLHRKVPLQPCLGDVWCEHILFEGNQVTGLIDFGGVRYDHPAQDLARLIGSYTQGDAVRRLAALSYYSPLTPELEQLTVLLDEAGAIVGVGNWLRWMVLEKRIFADQSRAIKRLQLLVNRLSRPQDHLL